MRVAPTFVRSLSQWFKVRGCVQLRTLALLLNATHWNSTAGGSEGESEGEGETETETEIEFVLSFVIVCIGENEPPAIYFYKPFDLWHRPRRQLGTSHQSPRKQCRRHYSEPAVPADSNRIIPAAPVDSNRIEPNRSRKAAASKARAEYLRRLARRNPWVPSNVFQDKVADNPKLEDIPTRVIYGALKEFQNSEATYHPITRLVEYLVKERGQRPNAALYESLIKANVDKKHGSAKAAGELLKEMRKHGISTTPEIYHALLEVTSVHPDYVLRGRVLNEMKNRWYDLTPNSNINIIIGLLRDGQYELALSKLEELNRNPISVPPWLLEVFLYTFGELGFHEEALAILKKRLEIADSLKRGPLSLNAWQFLLEVFSRDIFHPGVKYIWDHVVTPGTIHPPDGVITNALDAASIHGDAELAMNAIELLSSRGTKLDLHHYEALIQVYLHHGDLRKALSILCIMAKAGLSPDLACTRPIFELLRNSSNSTEHALAILHELKVHYTVPAAAFNILLESTAGLKGFKAAFDMYRTVRQICSNGPDLETFEILLRHCTLRKSMSFLVAEMEVFSLKPTRTILDHLVRICTMQDDYEMAFRYLEMMHARTPPGESEKWWISKGPALALLRRCIQDRDPRYSGVLEECLRRRLFDEEEINSLVSVRPNPNKVQGSSSHSESSSEKAKKPPESTKPLTVDRTSALELIS
ncbi:hypothetical protein GGR50DRAFT_694272 [Xylaria sp. CBS 124048]|nr:hypothetical protein GGR50DRAFT_694272 [Xylaria sp. CBS 124048]